MFNTSLQQTVLQDLIEIGVKKTFKSRHSLVNYKDRTNKLYLVLEGGIVLLHVHPITGNERAINFFIPDFHQIASIAESFYLNIPSDYHLKTFTNTTVIEITKQDFNTYLQTSPNAARVQDHGIQTLLHKNKLRANLVILDSLEMLQHLHKDFPQILQQVPSQYIADFLGITPQWLSHLKHKL